MGLDQELYICGCRTVYPEFIQTVLCFNLAALLKAVSTLGVAFCLRKERMLLNRRDMVISGGTGKLFPLGTGAHDSKGCSDEKCRDILSLLLWTSSSLINLPPPSSLPVTLSPVLAPLLSLSQVSHMKPDLLRYRKKGLK